MDTHHALLPLRLFLGGTFVYAGLDKLADPHYLAGADDPASFLGQLQSARAQSPVGDLLAAAGHVPTAAALLMAFGELAVGLGTLLGLWGRLAAAGGAVIGLVLWLSVSFHVQPYFLGNDLAYLVAWLPLVLAGTPWLSVDQLIARQQAATGGRRQLLVDGAIAALAVSGFGLLAGAFTARRRPRLTADQPTSQDAESVGSVPAAAVPVGGGVRTTAAGSGDPVFVCQPRAGEYVAFSGVCTHAGCTVNPPRNGEFVCPCHDSRFDAASGRVLQGPATAPLARYQVREQGGTVHIGVREG